MRMTDIRMEWTDEGAFVSFKSDFVPAMNCPRCGKVVNRGTEHRCGDKVLKPSKTRKKAKTGGAK